MTTLETFHSTLVTNPTDELTWLALADWLEETGREARSELVRLWLGLRQQVTETGQERLRELVAAGQTLPLPSLTNGVGMEFVLIPPGTFLMGSPLEELHRYEDEVLHSVTLTRPFWLGRTSVTQKHFQLITGGNPSRTFRHPTHPVENLELDMMYGFCASLSESRSELRANRVYRLPTESEWEYACRGAGVHTSVFSFGSSLSSEQANFNGNKPYGSAAANIERGRTMPVGSYPPNVLGLWDMHGNVWEMCSDRYHDDYDGSALTDPKGPETGMHCVVRGGAFDSGSIGCRCAHRGMGALVGDHDTGFRIVLEWRP